MTHPAKPLEGRVCLRRLVQLGALALAVHALPAAAQQAAAPAAAASAPEEQRIVVTGTRSAKAVDKIPGAITIISTRMPGRARATPPVARAGGLSRSTQASQTAFIPAKSAISASQT